MNKPEHKREMSWHGSIFFNIHMFWKNLRDFSFYNRTIFEFFFIILYLIEQLSLLWFTFNASNLQELGYIVAVFALIVLTTFALHKLLMESRIKRLEHELVDVLTDKIALQTHNRYILRKYGELAQSISESNIKKFK